MSNNQDRNTHPEYVQDKLDISGFEERKGNYFQKSPDDLIGQSFSLVNQGSLLWIPTRNFLKLPFLSMPYLEEVRY